MPGVKRPLKLGPPKYKVGQWLFHCFERDGAVWEIIINPLMISEVIKKPGYYEYKYKDGGKGQSHYFYEGFNTFLTFDEALDYWKQRIKKDRLSLLITEGMVI